jgi:hypothetical protein
MENKMRMIDYVILLSSNSPEGGGLSTHAGL